MKILATSPQDYIDQVSEDKKEAIKKLRQTVVKNLPKGFEETIAYNMITYVVPHALYPNGYHCDPSIPLPFISIAAQKNFVALYHMGIYSMPELHDWFVTEYQNRVPSKLDMGKSCIRWKKTENIPYELIAELCQQVTPQHWIDAYSTLLPNSRKK